MITRLACRVPAARCHATSAPPSSRSVVSALVTLGDVRHSTVTSGYMPTVNAVESTRRSGLVASTRTCAPGARDPTRTVGRHRQNASSPRGHRSRAAASPSRRIRACARGVWARARRGRRSGCAVARRRAYDSTRRPTRAVEPSMRFRLCSAIPPDLVRELVVVHGRAGARLVRTAVHS